MFLKCELSTIFYFTTNVQMTSKTSQMGCSSFSLRQTTTASGATTACPDRLGTFFHDNFD